MTALSDLLLACDTVQHDPKAATSTRTLATKLAAWAQTVAGGTPTPPPPPPPQPGPGMPTMTPPPPPAMTSVITSQAALTTALTAGGQYICRGVTFTGEYTITARPPTLAQ